MTFQLELPRALESAAEARHAMDALSAGLPHELLGDVRLLVSELVTNALRHAGLSPDDRIGLAVDVDDRRVRVEVTDPGPGFTPAPAQPDPEDAAGWGLYLVATLADRWGVETPIDDDRDDTLVWFELDRAPGRSGGLAA